MIAKLRGLGQARRFKLGAMLGVLAFSAPALAQGVLPRMQPQSIPATPVPNQAAPNQAPLNPATTNPVCVRLEGQLAAFDQGTADPTRADQIKRSEDAIAKQQADLDRAVA